METVQHPRLMLIEDDAKLAGAIREYLVTQGYEVTIIARGDLAVTAVHNQEPDLVILDLMLPGLDGIAVCQQLRPKYPGPILMLTARGELLDEIVGLEVGADDYIAKPVQPRLLLARIRALLRRGHGTNQAHQTIALGALVIDSTRRTVHLAQREVVLTSAEFDLLWHLANRAGEVVTRESLHLSLRGVEYDGLDRTIDLRISRLRTKLGDNPKKPARIKSIRGVGYMLTRG